MTIMIQKIMPNVLSGFRLVATPFLLYLAWEGHHNSFLVLLALSLMTDAFDGYIARRLDTTSEFGTRLDSLGDMATYLSVPLCAYWLWPEILKREVFFVLLVIVAYTMPLIAGYAKFRRFPSYHTWAAKSSAVLISIAVFMLFITDIAWPFRVAAVIQVLVACEEIAITLRLSELQSNVCSYWHVQKSLKH